MSDYISMYIQQRTDTGWCVPPAMPPHPDYEYYSHGYLFDFKACSAPLERLFLDEGALLRLNKEMPDDFRSTEVFRRHVQTDERSFMGWASVDDLLVDEWSELYLLACRNVPAQFAQCFSLGDQPFPRQELLEAGCSVEDTDELEDVSTSADARFRGRGGRVVETVDHPIVQYTRGDHLPAVIRVSWKLSVADFLGDWRYSALQAVREDAADKDLRIICVFGG